MNEQEINRRIAEYMKLWGVITPDYCHDLNAVWEVEEKLKADRKRYEECLKMIEKIENNKGEV